VPIGVPRADWKHAKGLRMGSFPVDETYEAKNRVGLIVLFILTSFFIALFGYMLMNKEIVVETGTITYLDFEGGFYGIVADDGEHYDPINLPSEFKEDGLRVMFIGKIREDLGSFHMWGKIIELTSIKKL